MTNTELWWRQSPFLNDIVAFINNSKSRGECETVSRCDDLCKALNKTWNAYRRFSEGNAPLSHEECSDSQSIKMLILKGLSERMQLDLAQKESFRDLCELTPPILNHETMMRRRYDPSNITENIQSEASEGHRELKNAYTRFLERPLDQSLREALLKKFAVLIYIVRCNIAHSEKTPHGPDLKKQARDRLVSKATARVLNDVFELIFDYPSQRLVTYGTLCPGGASESLFAGLEGKWLDGKINGVINHRVNGLVGFSWNLEEKLIDVKVFSASNLEQRFQQLDRYEGPSYQRVLVPVFIKEHFYICNIYRGAE